MRPPALLTAALLAARALLAGETLHNGIVLPDEWPPKIDSVASRAGSIVPPYLTQPPAVIPIKVGRQLFVDDFLIEKTTLQRTSHAAKYHPASPVLQPDQEWEKKGQPTAMPFSDGVWFDATDQLFKMWYMGGYGAGTCLATSKDGLRWDKTAFDVVPGTNVVQTETRDSTTVWLDPVEPDAQKRFKLWRSHRLKDHWGLTLHFSPDGIHWSPAALDTGWTGDRSTVFYDPFRAKWIYSLRSSWGQPRMRSYWEVDDLLQGPAWTKITDLHFWTSADKLDLPRADYQLVPELYNLDAVGYESLTVGLFTIWRGQMKERPKPNELCVSFSRDGFHWHRPTHEAFIPVSEDKAAWNWGNVQSAGGCCLIVGDELWFYVSARAAVPENPKAARSTTGLATLRRDGFVSMDAGAEGGTLTTRPLVFDGSHLFVNASVAQGELRAEVQDAAGQPIAGFEATACEPLHADATKQPLTWRGHPDLSKLAGQTVRLHFTLKRGSLYAFWITPDEHGASRGAIAAGGPGLHGVWDDGK